MRDLTKECSNLPSGRTETTSPSASTGSKFTGEILPAPELTPPIPPEPPTDRGERSVFREVFLLHFEPEEQTILRRGGDVLYTRILTAEPPHDPEPWTHARLRALARDLDFTADFLHDLGAEPEHSEPLDPDEPRLQAAAPSWARTARDLAHTIRRSLGPEPPGERSPVAPS